MSGYDFKLTTAKKEAVPPLIGLWSKSGGGKTFSALLLAKGIVGSGGKVVVIDTENGRAKFYAEEVEIGEWEHLSLEPPFTPDKFSAAFEFCISQGADIIIVDSASHVWEGEGGVIDMAENSKTKKGKSLTGLAKWNKPKMSHKRMMNKLIRSSIPVIFCLRSKDKIVQKGKGYDAEIINEGEIPIAEKNFVYEMTVCLHLTVDGRYDLSTSKTLPQALRSVIKENGVITKKMGEEISNWAGIGLKIDKETMDLRRNGRDSALQGLEEYTKWGKSLTSAQRNKVADKLSGWLEEAKKSEVENEEESELIV